MYQKLQKLNGRTLIGQFFLWSFYDFVRAFQNVLGKGHSIYSFEDIPQSCVHIIVFFYK